MYEEIKRNIELCYKYQAIMAQLRYEIHDDNMFQSRLADDHLYNAEDWFCKQRMDLEKLMEKKDV